MLLAGRDAIAFNRDRRRGNGTGKRLNSAVSQGVACLTLEVKDQKTDGGCEAVASDGLNTTGQCK